MKFSKSSIALLAALSLSALSAQAQNNGFGHNRSGSMAPSTNHPNASHIDRLMQANTLNGQWQWQAQHSKHYKYHYQRDQRCGYEKPKNPYNNGIHSPHHKFYRGDRLPVQYRGTRGTRYVVVDWHDHPRLYAPPAGMRWAYIDGRYILATIATGIIYNIIYGS